MGLKTKKPKSTPKGPIKPKSTKKKTPFPSAGKY